MGDKGGIMLAQNMGAGRAGEADQGAFARDSDTSSQTVPRLPAADKAAAMTAPNTALNDLKLLFSAIQARLAHLVSEAFVHDCLERELEPVDRIRTSVLECVADLAGLHASVLCEVDHPHWVVQAVPCLCDDLTDPKAAAREIQ